MAIRRVVDDGNLRHFSRPLVMSNNPGIIMVLEHFSVDSCHTTRKSDPILDHFQEKSYTGVVSGFARRKRSKRPPVWRKSREKENSPNTLCRSHKCPAPSEEVVMSNEEHSRAGICNQISSEKKNLLQTELTQDAASRARRTHSLG